MKNVKIFTKNIEEEAIEQVETLAEHPMFKDEAIRIMPDVHAGMGCVIGFTSTKKTDKIIPNLIGVDIGCGVLTVKLGVMDLDLKYIDDYINANIPHGFKGNEVVNPTLTDQFRAGMIEVCQTINDLDKVDYHMKSCGSLGGGNHFIEIAENSDKEKHLIIHSGSRNLGHKIATYFQQRAVATCPMTCIQALKYLEGKDAEEYIKCMKFAQSFATINRYFIAESILHFLNIKDVEIFETIHNYIGDDNIIRKGAVSAKAGEVLLIPMNMRDGSLLCVGKGNEDWNCSAPHGAGRVMSRTQAKAKIKLEDFEDQMHEVYSTSVCKDTLDEAPDAYKPMAEILANIDDTAQFVDLLRPIYNFKSH